MSLRRKKLAVLGTAVLAALGLAATASAGGVERLGARCAAEWDPNTGATSLYTRVDDTPDYPANVSGSLPFATATGEAIFTPSRKMILTCDGQGFAQGDAVSFPESTLWLGFTTCRVYRGGQAFSLSGSDIYDGNGKFILTPSGKTIFICIADYVSTNP